jgi:hypothetical protein
MRFSAWFVLILFFSTEGFAQNRELLVIKGGIDRVYGNYMTAVNGESGKTIEVWPLMPLETQDFVPQDGLDKQDLHLGDDGRVKIVKTLTGSMQVMMLGWLAPARYGEATLTIPIKQTVNQLMIMTPRGMMDIAVPANFVSENAMQEAGESYSVWKNTEPLVAGSQVTITVNGVPEGRMRLWGLAAMTAAAMLAVAAGAVVLARRS